MKLTHLKKLGEDEHYFHVQDGRDGTSFRVAKAHLGPDTLAAVTQHFADGGEVLEQDPKTGEYTIPGPDGGIGITKEHAQRLLQSGQYTLGKPAAPTDPAAGMEIQQAPQKLEEGLMSRLGLPSLDMADVQKAWSAIKGAMPDSRVLSAALPVALNAPTRPVKAIPSQPLPDTQTAPLLTTPLSMMPMQGPRLAQPTNPRALGTIQGMPVQRMAEGGVVNRIQQEELNALSMTPPGLVIQALQQAYGGLKDPDTRANLVQTAKDVGSDVNQLANPYVEAPTAQAPAPQVAPMSADPSPEGNFTPLQAPETVQAPEPAQLAAPMTPAGPPAPQGQGMGGGGLGTGAFDKSMAGALEAEQQGAQQKADVTGQLSLEQQAIQNAKAQKLTETDAYFQNLQNKNLADIERTNQEIASGKLDGDKWWASRNTAQKVAGTIGLILGGIGQAFGGGENAARSLIDKAIAQDIDIQKSELGRKENQLSRYMQQGHNIREATELARAHNLAVFSAQLESAAAKHAGEAAQAEALTFKGKAAQDVAKDVQSAHINTAKARADLIESQARMMAAGLKGNGQQIPAKEAADLGGLKAAGEMMDLLMQKRADKVGMFSAITQYFPGTDASKYVDARDLAAQTIGYLLEGGKMTDSDRAYYKGLLPSAGDSTERAKEKAENVKQLLALKGSGQLDALGRAGFNTSALQGAIARPMNAGQKRDAALAWARANKNDQRAKELLQLLGAG